MNLAFALLLALFAFSLDKPVLGGFILVCCILGLAWNRLKP